MPDVQVNQDPLVVFAIVAAIARYLGKSRPDAMERPMRVVPAEEPSMAQMPMSYRYGDIQSPFLSFEEPLTVQDREFVSWRAEQTAESLAPAAPRSAPWPQPSAGRAPSLARSGAPAMRIGSGPPGGPQGAARPAQR